MTIYQELKAAGCELDSHASDLYVQNSEKARTIIARHPSLRPSYIGNGWLEIPFAFDPFWKAKEATDV